MGPIAQADGHDGPRLIDELVPGVAAVVDQVVVGGEDAVGEPVLAHEPPDVLLRVQLRALRWQRDEGDVLRHGELGRGVPPGAVEPGCHAVLMLDQAGWHGSARLPVPANITLLPLPPRSPELNPVENVWQFMRDNWLSNRIFTSYNDLLDHCCAAWNKLTNQPWTIMSIGLRDWAYRS